MEQAIQKAIEGGYGSPEYRQWLIEEPDIKKWRGYQYEAVFSIDRRSYHVFCAHFWQALGKALGWEGKNKSYGDGWLFHWHRFIDHLAEGKDADSFFNELLK